MFGGQGQQWLGMGRELLASEPVFRDALGDIDRAIARSIVRWSLLDELAAPEDRSRLDATEVAQPAIFAIQVALAALWAAWGITPDGVVGHSIGEIAALHVAGVLPLDEAVRVVAHRGRVMQRATGHGAMAAVALDETQARKRCCVPMANRLSVAAINSPRGVVLSGEVDALDEALRALDQRGCRYRRLPVNYAFHSAQMDAAGDAISSQRSAPCRRRAARGSGVLDRQRQALPATIRSTPRFLAATSASRCASRPRSTRCSPTGSRRSSRSVPIRCSAARSPSAPPSADETPLQLASLRRGRPERESLLLACASLYTAAGARVAGPVRRCRSGGRPSCRIRGSTTRYWLRAAAGAAPRAVQATVHPLSEPLGRRLPTAGSSVFETSWPDRRARMARRPSRRLAG